MTATAQASAPLRFAELNVSNALLGDRAALEAAWERDGYWFFRDVLDREAVEGLRQAYVDELDRQGVIDPADPDARYNGKPFDAAAFRKNLHESAAWRTLVSNPKITAFFEALLAEPVHWVPNVVTRGTPPAPDTGAERLLFIHQDGSFNPGIPFFVTWVPLATVSAEMGGVALAEGMHRQGNLHPWQDGLMIGIDRADIPADRWRRTEYHAGDLLMMDVMTPHSGMSNISDRFRFSVDLRVMRDSGNKPIFGTLTARSDGGITVTDGAGDAHRLTLDETTYCRGLDGKKVPLARFSEAFPIGTPVLVGREGDHAAMVRPPH